MAVRANKPAFNIREKLKELTSKFGLKGTELARAETVQDARDLVSAGRKNIIINGDMKIAQRGTSGTGSGYTSVDRFKLTTSSADVTLSQGSLTSGSPYDKGFRNFVRVTNTSTTTATNGYRELDYRVEAQDLANSGWVISNPNSYATLSFWVRSSVSQRFYMYIRCADGTAKSYTFPFDTIANTWVKVEQTIPGDPTLTVNNDNGLGLLLRFVVHYGTNYTGTSATNNIWRVTGSDYSQDMSTLFALTTGATFDVTGVQLEVGKNATEFEHRSYGEELALCQRYYQKFQTSYRMVNAYPNVSLSSGDMIPSFPFPVQMRTAPTMSPTTVTTTFDKWNATGSLSKEIRAITDYTQWNFQYYASDNSNTNLTSGGYHRGVTTESFAFSAEL